LGIKRIARNYLLRFHASPIGALLKLNPLEQLACTYAVAVIEDVGLDAMEAPVLALWQRFARRTPIAERDRKRRTATRHSEANGLHRSLELTPMLTTRAAKHKNQQSQNTQ
jgi:hypothetical protein